MKDKASKDYDASFQPEMKLHLEINNQKCKHLRERAEELIELIAKNKSEEVIHLFLLKNPGLIQPLCSRWAGICKYSVLFSKFPITPDRIPDFTLIDRHDGCDEFDNITFIELKRPSASFFVGHNRMSKDVNDAWMEAIYSLRLLGPVYDDYIRLVEKVVRTNHKSRNFEFSDPQIECIIIIVRRNRLTQEDLSRVSRLIKKRFSFVVNKDRRKKWFPNLS